MLALDGVSVGYTICRKCNDTVASKVIEGMSGVVLVQRLRILKAGYFERLFVAQRQSCPECDLGLHHSMIVPGERGWTWLRQSESTGG